MKLFKNTITKMETPPKYKDQKCMFALKQGCQFRTKGNFDLNR